MPLHVLLESWRLATLHRLGEVQHDPVDVWFGAIGDKRLIRSVLMEDPRPFTDGDPFPWFAPLFVSVSFLLDVEPSIVRHRNRVRDAWLCELKRLLLCRPVLKKPNPCWCLSQLQHGMLPLHLAMLIPNVPLAIIKALFPEGWKQSES
jgi:hypothetical protein